VAEVAVPEFDQNLKDTFFNLFCRATFYKGNKQLELNPECGAYFLSFSYQTMLQIVQTCIKHCREYSWAMVLLYTMCWMNSDPANRMEGIELLKNMCYEKVSNNTLSLLVANPVHVLCKGIYDFMQFFFSLYLPFRRTPTLSSKCKRAHHISERKRRNHIPNDALHRIF
jgi:hypothetical protein